MTKLLVVDDSELIRSRLLGLLRSIPGRKAIDNATTLTPICFSDKSTELEKVLDPVQQQALIH